MVFSSPIISSASCYLAISSSGFPGSFLDPFEHLPFGLGFAARALGPVERAFPDHVNQTGREQGDENKHLEIDKIAQAVLRAGKELENHGPGNQKNYFNVEQDEDHRDQIELDRETLVRRTDRILAAFVRHQFRARAFALTDKLRQSDEGYGEPRRHAEHQQHRQIIHQSHRSSVRRASSRQRALPLENPFTNEPYAHPIAVPTTL